MTKKISLVDPPIDARDFVMARMSAARLSAQVVIDAIDEFTGHMVEPEDDAKGRDRKSLLQDALEAAGCTARALESAEETLSDVDFSECEPWDEDSDDEDDEDDDDKPRIPRATARERRRD